MLVEILAASISRNALVGRGVIRAGEGCGWKFLMPQNPLTNFKIKNTIKINPNLMVFIQEIIYVI